MSTSKTMYPGMPDESAGNGFAPQFPSGHSQTIFPGMQASGENQALKNNKPIMGFLFSVSKTMTGEFWPLYLGPNTIGRGTSNSVSLKEKTVSDSHATLVIRKMQKNGENNGSFVFIQDTGSTCGTMLNGETLDFNPRPCSNGDIITIGANYELYLILVDPDQLGLNTKEGFASSETTPAFQQGQWTPVGGQSGADKGGTLPGNGSSPFEGRRPTQIYMPDRR